MHRIGLLALFIEATGEVREREEERTGESGRREEREREERERRGEERREKRTKGKGIGTWSQRENSSNPRERCGIKGFTEREREKGWERETERRRERERKGEKGREPKG